MHSVFRLVTSFVSIVFTAENGVARRRAMLLCLIPVLLQGCGGSSSPTSEADIAPLSNGRLGPVLVSGLSYSSPSSAGVTTASGGFSYREGETVEFRLGDATLGEAAGSPSVDLFTLQGAEALSDVESVIQAFDSAGPYLSAANGIRLLYSLDDDQNPDNGLALSDETARAFEGAAIDFSASPRAFAYTPDVLEALDRLGRQMMPLSRALGIYYQQASIPLLQDGIPVGRAVKREILPNAAAADSFTAFASERGYNELGDLVEEWTSRGQSADRQLARYEYSPNGLRLSVEQRVNDAVLSLSQSSHNVAGDVTETISTLYLEPTRVTSHRTRYNVRGLPEEEVSETSGSPSVRTVTRYDVSDRVTSRESDFNGDGVAESFVQRRYNDLGQLVEEVNGTPGIAFFGPAPVSPPVLVSAPASPAAGPGLGIGAVDNFDPTSPRQSVGSVFFGGVAGGTFPVIGETRVTTTNFFWNDAGYLVRRQTDTDDDGRADSVSTYRYEALRLAEWSHDSDGDGIADQSARYFYNENDQLIRVVEDRWERGIQVSTTRDIAYDIDGRRIAIDRETDSGLSRELFSYDEAGRLTTTESICVTPCAVGEAGAAITNSTEWQDSTRLSDSEVFRRYTRRQ